MIQRYQPIIDAIAEKAQRECPGSLALIGVYGSCLTGDTHEKSDLDLLILIHDEKGYCLATTFIESEAGIGHDLYCTTWQALEADAQFRHPHISKLMESNILYCADEASMVRLESLRQKARETDPRGAATETLDEARKSFARVMTADSLGQARYHAGYTIHHIADAIALLNGRYFRMGVRRIFEELEAMPLCPSDMRGLVNEILAATDIQQMQDKLTSLLRAAEALFPAIPVDAKPFPGTYEEMFSNWRNKMYLAAETDDRFLSFDSLCALNGMLLELGYDWNLPERFDPADLQTNARLFDETLKKYLKEYEKADITPAIYPTLEDFLSVYSK